jgi:protein-L-isoaspartate O-methyltransferase
MEKTKSQTLRPLSLEKSATSAGALSGSGYQSAVMADCNGSAEIPTD